MTDKFKTDVLWNVASLGLAGVCGVGVNFLIGLTYGVGALGVFNQVFAIYVVFSQLAALGVHTSVLTHGAAEDRHDEQRRIVTSALLVVAVQALLMALVFILVRGPAADFLDSEPVADGIAWAAPGLVFFALNKVTLAALNARRRMRWYATFQAARVVLMVPGFGTCVLLDAPASALPVVLSASEGLVFITSMIVIRDQLRRSRREWIRKHVSFGLRGFLSGLFTDINTRIDVFILGAFATDTIVGAYSFAALIAEGVYQILIALRTNYAPLVVRGLAAREYDDVARIVRRGRNRTALGAVVVGSLCVLGYWLLIPFFTSDPMIEGSYVYFAILIAGMGASAGYAPFNQLLLWAGRPGAHTMLVALIVPFGAMANALLASQWSAVGAAIATAAMHVWSVVILRIMVRRLLRVPI